MDNLNCFNPFWRPTKPKSAVEDDLTRAYLVLLRLSPQALSHFLNLVDQKLAPPFSLPANDILAMQLSSIQTQLGSVKQETGTVISVLIRNSGPTINHQVQWSNRQPIYDGLICYDPSLIFIIEAKLDDIGPLSQLDPAISSFSVITQQGIKNNRAPYATTLDVAPNDVKLYQDVIVLEWRDIISGLGSLFSPGNIRNRCSNPLTNQEMTLYEDFFEFVDSHFSYLGPYKNLQVCNHQSVLLGKRCDSILGQVAKNLQLPNQVLSYSRVDGNYITLSKASVERLWFVFLETSDSLRLSVYPGDTVNQAKRLFDQTNLAVIEQLKAKDWLVEPNLHFSFIRQHQVWSVQSSKVPLKVYWDYWIQHKADIKQWGRPDWTRLMNELQKAGLMNSTDIQNFDDKFTKTTRQAANVIPGLSIEYHWALSSASGLDLKGGLVQEVEVKANELLQVLP